MPRFRDQEPEAIQRRLERLSRAIRRKLWGRVRLHFRLLAITRYWLKLSDEWRRFKALYVDTKRNPEETEKEWGWLRRWDAGRPWPWLPPEKEWFVRVYWETRHGNRLFNNEWTKTRCVHDDPKYDLENAQLEFKYDLRKELENAARGSLLGRFENYVRHSETCAEWHKSEWQDELWRRRRTAAHLGPSVGYTPVDPDVRAKCTQLRWELVRRHVRLRAIVRYWKRIRPHYVRYCPTDGVMYWAGPPDAPERRVDNAMQCDQYGPSWVVDEWSCRYTRCLLHKLVNNGDFLAPKGWEVVRRHVERRARKAQADRQAAAREAGERAVAREYAARREAMRVWAGSAEAERFAATREAVTAAQHAAQMREAEAAEAAQVARLAVIRAEAARRPSRYALTGV